MEEKVLKLITYYDPDWHQTYHAVLLDGKKIFQAQDLTECPEDAIIGRDLFDGTQFIEAVELGYNLAQDGYKLKIETIEAKTLDEFETLCR